MTTKLHELIAVKPELKRKAQEELIRVLRLFTQELPAFQGLLKTYKPLDDKGEPQPPEVKIISNTVSDELQKIMNPLTEWLDVDVQIEHANTLAEAVVIVDGKTVTPSLPVGALLNLESKLIELRRIVEHIPVLDPSEKWAVDESMGSGIYSAVPVESYRTVKKIEFRVVVEADANHPAQVQQVSYDERVGKWTLVRQSGAMSLKDNNALLQRLDVLLRAVKQARERANAVEVDTSLKVGGALMKYILGQ